MATTSFTGINNWIVLFLILELCTFTTQVSLAYTGAYRRTQADLDLLFPEFLDVSVSSVSDTRTHNVKLNLERKDDLHNDIPGFILDGDKLERITSENDTLDFRLYRDTDSGAAVTILCDWQGTECRRYLSGFYRQSTHIYQIDRLEGDGRVKRSEDLRGEILHEVTRRTGETEGGLIDGVETQTVSVTITIGNMSRRKRYASFSSSIVYTVELLLVTDYPIHERFVNMNGQDKGLTMMKQYYFQVVNGMAVRYEGIKDHVIINVRLAAYVLAKSRSDSPWTETLAQNGAVDVKRSLHKFANFQGELRKWLMLNHAGTVPDYDHAVSFSGYDLQYQGRSSTLGYAYLGTMCGTKWSVSVVEDKHDLMKTTWTVSHEMGHSLGARHDGSQNVCIGENQYIMTYSLKKLNQRNERNPWLFSVCSVAYFQRFITELNNKIGSKHCLRRTEPTNVRGSVEWIAHTRDLIGYLHTPDEQCQFIYGPGSRMCREYLDMVGNVCTKMYCYSPRHGRCQFHLPADGTSCGSKKWCGKGRCIASYKAPIVGACAFGDQPGLVPLGGGQQMSCNSIVQYYGHWCRAYSYIKRCCCTSCLHGGARVNPRSSMLDESGSTGVYYKPTVPPPRAPPAAGPQPRFPPQSGAAPQSGAGPLSGAAPQSVVSQSRVAPQREAGPQEGAARQSGVASQAGGSKQARPVQAPCVDNPRPIPQAAIVTCARLIGHCHDPYFVGLCCATCKRLNSRNAYGGRRKRAAVSRRSYRYQRPLQQPAVLEAKAQRPVPQRPVVRQPVVRQPVVQQPMVPAVTNNRLLLDHLPILNMNPYIEPEGSE